MSMRHHGVTFCADDALPPDRDWVLLDVGGALRLVAKRSRVSEDLLTEAWVAYDRMVAEYGLPECQASANPLHGVA
jgi:hypothetical protein